MRRVGFNGRLEDLTAFSKRVYCDRTCMAAGYEGTMKVPNEKNSRRQSAKCREQKCNRCDRLSHHVHHRDRNPMNNDPSNLESLCASCHKLEHLPVPATPSRLA